MKRVLILGESHGSNTRLVLKSIAGMPVAADTRKALEALEERRPAKLLMDKAGSGLDGAGKSAGRQEIIFQSARRD